MNSKTECPLSIGFSVLLIIYCADPVEVIPYNPEITFTGYINNIYDSLAGNFEWPNRCRLVGDTIRIFCYSTSFNEVNRIRQGDLLRIDLYPDSITRFTKYNTLFHLARYHNQNESYTINTGDTADMTIQFQAETIAYTRQVGAAFELTDIYVSTPPMVQGQYLVIKEGHLFGSVHR